MRSLVTAANGLPTLTNGLTRAHSSSVNGNASSSASAAAVMAASSSGVGKMVPDLSFGMTSHLSVVGLAQADDVEFVLSLNERDVVQPLTDVPDSDHACLTIIPARVQPGHRGIPFELACFGQGYTVLDGIYAVLAGVDR